MDHSARVSESLRNFTIDFHPAIVASDFDIKRGDNRSHRCFHALKGIAVEGQRFPRCERSFPDTVKRRVLARMRSQSTTDVPSIESESRGYVTTVVRGNRCQVNGNLKSRRWSNGTRLLP